MKWAGKISIAAIMLFPTAFTAAQEFNQDVLDPTRETRALAGRADAPLLSPKTYLKADRAFEHASDDLKNGKKPERVRAELTKAESLFRQALENAEKAKLVFDKCIESRASARDAEAERLAASDWIAAEKTFNAAVLALESDKLKAAQKKNDEANELYRTAELNAIRTRLLAEPWQLIAEIHQRKFEQFVPQTLGQVKQLVQRVEELIAADRHELDGPRQLADRAAASARQALYIGSLASRVESGETSVEELILRWNSTLSDIARAANIEPDLAGGPDKTSAGIIALLEEIPELRSDLEDRDAMIAGLEEEIRELDSALGGASADRSKLIRRLEQQARIREQFRQVENMFTDDEAVVLRDGNNLIVRLIGLTFDSGSSELDEDAGILLKKVDKAVDVFPDSRLTVEGHTDSKGNAEKNLALSGERARAVKTYLTEVLHIPAFRIEAVGYGDTRPVANNRTEEGRARNRRIDLIISPNPESL